MKVKHDVDWYITTFTEYPESQNKKDVLTALRNISEKTEKSLASNFLKALDRYVFSSIPAMKLFGDLDLRIVKDYLAKLAKRDN